MIIEKNEKHIWKINDITLSQQKRETHKTWKYGRTWTNNVGSKISHGEQEQSSRWSCKGDALKTL